MSKIRVCSLVSDGSVQRRWIMKNKFFFAQIGSVFYFVLNGAKSVG